MATSKAGRQIFTAESFMTRFEQTAETELLQTVTRVISSKIDFHDSENSVRGRLLNRVRREAGLRKSLTLETQTNPQYSIPSVIRGHWRSIPGNSSSR